MQDAVSTEETTSTEAMTETEGMASMPEHTSTEEITSTEEMTTVAISVPFEAIQLILEFAPGAETPLHSHGGPGLVTVLEGEVTHRPQETGEETVYSVGEFWLETPGMVHVASNAGQENARTAAIFLLPEGASLTIAQEGTSSGDMPPGPTVVYRTSMSVTTATE
jgi:quercetin dioxygenase-like cupin family protein